MNVPMAVFNDRMNQIHLLTLSTTVREYNEEQNSNLSANNINIIYVVT